MTFSRRALYDQFSYMNIICLVLLLFALKYTAGCVILTGCQFQNISNIKNSKKIEWLKYIHMPQIFSRYLFDFFSQIGHLQFRNL